MIKSVKNTFGLILSLSSLTGTAIAYPPKYDPSDPHGHKMYFQFTPTIQGLTGATDPHNLVTVNLPIKIGNIQDPEEWVRWREEKEIYAPLLVGIPMGIVDGLASTSLGYSLALPGLYGVPGIIGSGAIGGSLASIPTGLLAGTSSLLAGTASAAANLVSDATSLVVNSIGSATGSGSITAPSLVAPSISLPSLTAPSLGGVASSAVTAAAYGVGSAALASPNLTSFASLIAPPLSTSLNLSSGLLGGAASGGSAYVGFSGLYVR